MLKRCFVFSSMVLLAACGSSSDDNAANTPVSSCAADACYRITMNEVWSQANFPTQYPSGSHFSALIGGVHGNGVDFFELNQSASTGIEDMAETGGTSDLRNEVNAAIGSGTALALISGSGIASSRTSVTVEIELSNAFPLVTLVSMLAPSPDWFTGVDSLSLQDSSGNFVDSLTVNLEVFDAGSDSGVTFNSANADSNSVITKLSCADLVNDCGFSNGRGTDGTEFIGTLVFERIL